MKQPKLYIRKVRLNSGGYDSSGSYWGIGAPLYEYTFETEEDCIQDHLRAHSREHAKEMIIRRYHLVFKTKETN